MPKYKAEYVCKWPCCGHRFEKIVGYSEGKGGGWTAVKCPNCGGPLKPDKDAVNMSEVKERRL